MGTHITSVVRSDALRPGESERKVSLRLRHESGTWGDASLKRWFAADGWRVVRVPNTLVIAGGDLALAPIKLVLREKLKR